MSSTVSNVIPELLVERGWTTETLAQELGLPTSAVESWLSPGFSPGARTIARTCKPLGYKVMVVPADAEVDGGYAISE